MSTPAKIGRRVVTGLFEIDLVSGQVLRQGLRIPVQEQPFRVLALLMERPGQLVTREELQAQLWPVDTYVGFDEGLNTAIRKLRVLFGDSADNPRFIETIPRRGYRFIAPVNEVPRVGEPLEHTNGTSFQKDAGVETISEATTEATVDRSTKANEAVLHGSKSSGWTWTILVTLAAALIPVLVVVARRDRVLPPPEKTLEKHEKLAVLPFQNLSNDPGQEYFSDGLTEETITDLGQLSPVQLGVIARTSAMAYKHTNKTVSQIGHELGVDYILEGSVRREPGRARISAQLIRVSDQTHLWAQSYDARNLNDLIDVQNAIARAIADAVQVNVSPQQSATARAGASGKPRGLRPLSEGAFLLQSEDASLPCTKALNTLRKPLWLIQSLPLAMPVLHTPTTSATSTASFRQRTDFHFPRRQRLAHLS